MSEIIEPQYWTKKINMAAQSVTVLIGAGVALLSVYYWVTAIDEVKISIKEHNLNWLMLVDLEVLEDRSCVFIGGRLHVI